MTKAQKLEFIDALFHSVRKTLAEKLPSTPEEWDGHELRVWVSQYFNDAAAMSSVMKDKRGKRRRDFDNEVIVRNL